MPVPMHATGGNGLGYGNNGTGFGQQSQYTPVPNPGVAGVGAGGRGFVPANRASLRDGPEGAAAQMLAADAAIAAKYRSGLFQEGELV